MQNVMDPAVTFKNLFSGWWKIAVLAIIGGFIGLAVSFILPPTYQAEATFHASIDFTQINFENLVGEGGHPLIFTQYDEDLALQVVERILLSVRSNALSFAKTLDPELDGKTFWDNMQIQRYLARWQLRYRHEDPQIAQAIVNNWASIGMEALLNAQETGRAESFVIVSLVSEAELPQMPTYQNRSILVLAGTMVGFLSGIILVDFKARYLDRRKLEA
jgi:uncharacterized protein involved in exopolysaccharide biosynthesis